MSKQSSLSSTSNTSAIYHSVSAKTSAVANSSISGVKKFLQRLSQAAVAVERWFGKHPILSLTILLTVLFVAIAGGNYLRKPDLENQVQQQPKQVKTYTVGAVPRVEVLGTGQKTGAVTIVSQASGVVRSIPVKPGQEVAANTRLVVLSSNYSGGSAPTIQRQLAQKQYAFVEETFATEQQTVELQRQIAQKTDQNADEYRAITQKSIQETKDLITLNESIIATFDQTIANSANDSEVLSAKQAKASYTATTNQLKQALRNSEYQVNADNPPATLSDAQRELALKQLDIQSKALTYNKEISLLQYKLAQINESLMSPSAPFSGTVERVFVRPGQQVNSGTPLATLFTPNKATQVVVLVSSQLANQISPSESSWIFLPNNTIVQLQPDYVSAQPTDGVLHSVVFTLPADQATTITEKQKYRVSVPLGLDTATGQVSVPIEAVQINEQQATVFTMENGVATAKQVQLGAVEGSFVRVNQGLEQGSTVILNRDVIEGELVESLPSLPDPDLTPVQELG